MATSEQSAPVAAVASMCNISERRVYQLVKTGVIPKSESGRFPLARAVRSYVIYLQGLADGSGNSVDLEEAKRRKLAAEAALSELELKRAESRVIPTVAHLALVDAIYATTRAAFLSLSNNLTPQLASANTPAKLKHSLETHARSCLAELAETLSAAVAKLESTDSAAPAAHEKAVAAAAPIRRRVGRPRKGTQP